MTGRYSDYEELRPLGEATHLPDDELSSSGNGESRRQRAGRVDAGYPDDTTATAAECTSCGKSVPVGQTKCRFCLTNHLDAPTDAQDTPNSECDLLHVIHALVESSTFYGAVAKGSAAATLLTKADSDSSVDDCQLIYDLNEEPATQLAGRWPSLPSAARITSESGAQLLGTARSNHLHPTKRIEQLCESLTSYRSYWYIMTDTRFEHASRRTVLRLIGAGATGGAGITGIASANRGNSGEKGGKRPLEETPSLVAALNYRGTGTAFQGFPDEPAAAYFDPGQEFDTTKPEVVVNGRLIHYQLPFGTHKPYVLHHEGGGRYAPRGAVTNFETDGSAPPGLPAGRYRATVREEINLYEKGGYFDWSVTRVDFFDRPEMEYVTSTLIILWDEDTKENDDPSVRTNDPSPGEDTPEFSEDVLGDIYEDIKTAAEELIDAGISTPGGT